MDCSTDNKPSAHLFNIKPESVGCYKTKITTDERDHKTCPAHADQDPFPGADFCFLQSWISLPPNID